MEVKGRGKLFVVEGACDGIGKSTQYALLKERLENDGDKVFTHHFPSYETFHGEPVTRYLSGELGGVKDLSPYFINGLYAMDRGCAWQLYLRKEFEAGHIVLLDRYTTSSLIYQSALIEDIGAKKEFIDYVIDFEYQKVGLQKPDNVIFLHAPFDVVTELRNARKQNDGVMNDIHERDLEFMKKVYDSAMFVADYLSWDQIECARNGKFKPIEEIHEDVYSLVKKKK